MLASPFACLFIFVFFTRPSTTPLREARESTRDFEILVPRTRIEYALTFDYNLKGNRATLKLLLFNDIFREIKLLKLALKRAGERRAA